MRLALAVLVALPLAAVEVPLCAPASTIIPASGPVPTGGVVVSATVTVPADAPTDLGVGAWAGDRHGSWAGRPGGRLTPGRHAVVIDLAAQAPADGPSGWGPWAAADAAKAGLFFWSAAASSAVIRIDDLRVAAAAPSVAGPAQVVDLAWPSEAATGHRWEATFRVTPEPADPFATDQVDAALVITRPDGAVERRPAFWDQPMADRDRGDAEEVRPVGPGRYAVRWRPRVPGRHTLRLEVTAGGRTITADLPAITVTGTAWDAYARVDATDRRFLSIAGRFWWPVGVNLRSINDVRSVENVGTRPLPERGTRAYAAYLDRFAAAGADAAEVWLSSWNLALEWHPGWDGFQGPGRYHLGHAWQLDRILERAETNGQRLVLVIHNHGQGSSNCDREWQTHPYNRANGGFLDDAALLFTDARARALQFRLHRYLAARYGDSPAVLAWKLWSEVDLTDGGRTGKWPEVTAWHRDAAEHLAKLDTYDHPITSHFSGSWRRVQSSIAELPGLHLLTIDAYHGGADEAGGISLADLLALSGGARGLAKYQKPVVVTECGGTASGAPEPQLMADHRMGAWVALTTGLAASPMLWWSQWIDQGDRFGPYRAIRPFLAGEDLRGTEAVSTTLRGDHEDLWVRAWVRPGRILGYAQSRRFAADGSETPLRGMHIQVGEVVAPGRMAVQWWNADTGAAGPVTAFDHPGGALSLEIPDAKAHIAFKLTRPTGTP
jgi:hypothetical protein